MTVQRAIDFLQAARTLGVEVQDLPHGFDHTAIAEAARTHGFDISGEDVAAAFRTIVRTRLVLGRRTGTG